MLSGSRAVLLLRAVYCLSPWRKRHFQLELHFLLRNMERIQWYLRAMVFLFFSTDVNSHLCNFVKRSLNEWEGYIMVLARCSLCEHGVYAIFHIVISRKWWEVWWENEIESRDSIKRPHMLCNFKNLLLPKNHLEKR